ncbi:MAG: NAD(+) synthase [Oscillospiraceae bacterium]|nr:NAD(+) synthase [Oscillospiraceae bacterium]
MRDYSIETIKRVEFIREALDAAGAQGIVYGNSGGKDCALVGILCKMACANTVGIVMPCGSRRNYSEDLIDAKKIADQFEIETRIIDLGSVAQEIRRAVGEATQISDAAASNFAPRLRMMSLYAVAASEGRLVAGTGNRSEIFMGYFTKWGDGAYDFNPIADLTVSEVYEFLRHLGAPLAIIEKAPSAGLFEGQTDEGDMGVSYGAIDEFLLRGVCGAEDLGIIKRFHDASEHKRMMPKVFGDTSRI